MSELDAAADSFIQWTERNKAILELGATLKKIGSIENATVERKQALSVAAAAHEDMLVQVAAAKTDLESVKAAHAATLADHQNTLTGMTAAAEAAAEGIREKGRQDAAHIVATAKANTDAELAAHANKMAQATTALANANASIAAATAARDKTYAERDAAAAEHAAVTQKIAALKATAASVLA